MELVTFVALTAVALSACGKDQKVDTTTMGISSLLSALDQTSLDQIGGNCASIKKLTPPGRILYSATLSSTPKSRCNQETILGRDVASRTEILTEDYDAGIAIATSVGCSAASITTMTNAKNNAIAANTQTNFDTLVSNNRFISVEDLRVEAMNALTTTTLADGSHFTESEVMNLNRLPSDQNKIAKQMMDIVINSPGIEAACITAISNKMNADFPGFLGLDQTAATKATITGVELITCNYGPDAIGSICSTLNTEF